LAESGSQRLRFADGIMERLRASYAEKSREELLDLVCELQKTYVLEQTIPFDLPMPERAEPTDRPDVPEGQEQDDDPDATPTRRFARLIAGLRQRTGLPQLEGFATDAEGRAVLVVDNQKVVFGDRVTVEFVPRGRGDSTPVGTPAPRREPPTRPGAPEPAAPPAPAPPRPAGAPPQQPGAPPAAEQPATAPEPPAKKESLDDVDHVVERFRGLELD